MREFDPLNYLTDDSAIAAYLQSAVEINDDQHFLDSLHDAIRAQAINQLAAKTGIDRQVIYEMFRDSKTAKPDPVYIHKITATFGVTTPVHA